ncbi:hypothetical protein TNCV_4582441 [Trichonephila clavipes]|nr:hypothetical protein TNCV_4582441 [Trichonephila clavipes]
MKTTPELAPLSPNFHTTPMSPLSLDRFNMHQPPLHGVFGNTRLKFMACWPRAHDHNHYNYSKMAKTVVSMEMGFAENF